jgi:aspartate aminotransferase-like enzyme
MPALLPNIDPDGLLEFSVVFTDRSLNHMSNQFQQVMNDISNSLKGVYNAEAVVIVPGGGTFGMEAIARQFAHDKKCMVLRNGWFSYRWSQIFDAGNIPASCTVHKAKMLDDSPQSPFAPISIDAVVSSILEEKPDVVFAPHVETSSGIILPEEYIQAVGEAVQQVGGLFVLDCIASGTVWLDMQKCNIDVLLSAPQKGWSASPCSALVMLGDRALKQLEVTESSSFAGNLKQWHNIMQAYENGGHAYHATMPTDALKKFRDTVLETEKIGFDTVRDQQIQLGKKVRALFAEKGFKSVAAEGFGAPGVAVFYTDDATLQMGKPFLEQGLQIAAGVPLQCDEPEDYRSFRIGLFGLDKLQNIDQTVANLEEALEAIS